MDPRLIYLVPGAALLALITLYHIAQSIRRYISSLHTTSFRIWLLYTNVLPRRISGANNVLVGHALLIIAFASLNALALLIHADDSEAIAKRSAWLFLVNMWFLAFGAYPSPLTEHLFGIPLRFLEPTHFWIGRIAAILFAVHVSLMSKMNTRAVLDPLMLAIVAATTLIVSLPTVFLRRRFYEVVSKVHIWLALSLFVLVWLHVPLSTSFNWICMTAASATVALRWMTWLGSYWYRNRTFRASSRFAQAPSCEIIASTTKLIIPVSRPWKFLPGQHVNLRFSGIYTSGWIPRRMQSHPFQIAWYSGRKVPSGLEPETDVTSTDVYEIEVLAKQRRGLSNLLHKADYAFIDGPYGGLKDMMDFETVILVSSGLGIVSHLSIVKYLLESSITKRLTRRIDLIWFSQGIDDSQMIAPYLQKLVDLDSYLILSIKYRDPSHVIGEMMPKQDSPAFKNILQLNLRTDVVLRKQIRFDGGEDELSALKTQFGASNKTEAGRTAILICGPPRFEQNVRTALRIWPPGDSVRVYYSDYEPLHD